MRSPIPEPQAEPMLRATAPLTRTAATRARSTTGQPWKGPDSGWLSELLLHLYQIQSAVVVSAAALRRQNCELDDDIANVLQRSVADRIQDQIDRAEGALQRLAGPARE